MAETTARHRLPEGSIHRKWNRRLEPRLAVRAGDEVAVAAPDASNGEITPNTRSADLATIDYWQLDPLAGPIFIEGAQPGDALKIDILEIKPATWGWSALLPGFGLLADEFPEPLLWGWDIDRPHIEVPSGARFDLHPMVGCMGVAPAEDGDHASITPTRAAGNLDCRYLTAGASLLVPVFNEGALLSLTDGHAIQGDGEICGTGIECRADITIRVDVIKDARLEGPEILTTETHPAPEGYRIFTGIGPDLMEATKEAVRRSIAPLARAQGVSEAEAYTLLGLLGELRIHEVVDVPNWVVGCMLPRRLF